MKTLDIEGKKIGKSQPVFIIAEAGVNHNGKLNLALKLIDAAADAGADAIKFQTFHAEEVVTNSGKMADYQKKNLGVDESQLSMLRKLELKEEYYPALIARAKKRKITFLSTPHGGFQSVDFLRSLNMPALKVGSGDLTNLPLLKYIALQKKPVILSTGMAFLKEVEAAVETIRSAGNDKIIILHCTSSYPCLPGNVNLNTMVVLANKFGVPVGLSDHTTGSQAAVMATTLGACVIEKHLTLDRRMTGPDQKTSEEPRDFKSMVGQIREVSAILGSAIKRPTKEELRLRDVARKSIVAGTDIKEGSKITLASVAIKRPGTGLSPRYLSKVVDKIAKNDIAKDQPIKLSDLL